MAAIYTANHLEKKYGGRAALRDVSFSIEPGKLVGLLGPNGAGKSTLIKCSMGLLTPTSGEIAIGGVKPGPASNVAARTPCHAARVSCHISKSAEYAKSRPFYATSGFLIYAVFTPFQALHYRLFPPLHRRDRTAPCSPFL